MYQYFRTLQIIIIACHFTVNFEASLSVFILNTLQTPYYSLCYCPFWNKVCCICTHRLLASFADALLASHLYLIGLFSLVKFCIRSYVHKWSNDRLQKSNLGTKITQCCYSNHLLMKAVPDLFKMVHCILGFNNNNKFLFVQKFLSF